MQSQLLNNNKAFFRQLIFLVILFFLGIVIFKQLSFFFGSFLGSVTLYFVFRNTLFRLTEGKHKLKPWVASLMIVLISTVALLGLGFLVFEVTAPRIANLDTSQIVSTVDDWISIVGERFGIHMGLENLLSQSTSFFSKIASSVFNTAYSFVINILLMMVILYFMLAHARAMEETVYEYSPFKGESLELMKTEVRNIIYSNAVGIPLIMIGQAFAAYLLYLAFGIPNAIFWAFLTALCGLIPMIGTALVTVPMGIIVMMDGFIGKGLLIIFCGLFVIANVDNLLRIILLKKSANTHPLIVIFGVILGIPLFGFWGIIFGPLLISVFLLLIKIYYREYKLLNPRPEKVAAPESGPEPIGQTKSPEKHSGK